MICPLKRRQEKYFQFRFVDKQHVFVYRISAARLNGTVNRLCAGHFIFNGWTERMGWVLIAEEGLKLDSVCAASLPFITLFARVWIWGMIINHNFLLSPRAYSPSTLCVCRALTISTFHRQKKIKSFSSRLKRLAAETGYSTESASRLVVVAFHSEKETKKEKEKYTLAALIYQTHQHRKLFTFHWKKRQILTRTFYIHLKRLENFRFIFDYVRDVSRLHLKPSVYNIPFRNIFSFEFSDAYEVSNFPKEQVF